VHTSFSYTCAGHPCTDWYMPIQAPSASQQQLLPLWIACIAAALMMPCACTLHSTHHRLPPIHRVLLHSVQSIPTAAFPSARSAGRSVPYRMVNSSAPCAVELSFLTSAFDDNLPMRVVPPHTGYPRASKLKLTDGGGDCGLDFDLCAQPFQVTLQVKRPCALPFLLF
jgi:hypothetical protein